MYKFFVIFKQDLRNIILNPVLIFSNVAFPILLILVLGFLSKSTYSNNFSSFNYYGITILLYTIVNISLTASNSFMDEEIKNSNLRILYSPIKISYVYISKILAATIFSSICSLIVIILTGLILKVNWGGYNVGYVLCIMILFTLLSSTIGVFLCCVLRSEDLTNTILSVVNTVVAILGGLFFQINGFGKIVRGISYISPAKWVSEGIFKIIYDNNFSLFIPTIIVLIVFTGVLMFLCKLIFKTEDYV